MAETRVSDLGHLIAFELFRREGLDSGCRFSVWGGREGLNHRWCRLTKLLPHLIWFQCGFDVVPDAVMVCLDLDDRQLPRPVCLGL